MTGAGIRGSEVRVLNPTTSGLEFRSRAGADSSRAGFNKMRGVKGRSAALLFQRIETRNAP
jgi:hypothetical protein